MARAVLLLDLVDDPASIARYEAWHRAGAVPPAVVAGIRRADVTAMDIYRLGTRLVMVMECGPGFDAGAKARADAADPDIMAWERLMGEMQRPVPGTDPAIKWAPARPIFSLDEQA